MTMYELLLSTDFASCSTNEDMVVDSKYLWESLHTGGLSALCGPGERISVCTTAPALLRGLLRGRVLLFALLLVVRYSTVSAASADYQYILGLLPRTTLYPAVSLVLLCSYAGP